MIIICGAVRNESTLGGESVVVKMENVGAEVLGNEAMGECGKENLQLRMWVWKNV